MSEAAEKIKQHFGSMGRRSLAVPEWGLTLWWTPVTLADRHKIYAGSKSENDYKVLAEILLVKAENEDGSKMFTPDDRAALLQKTDSEIMIRVAATIMSGGPPAAELKN